MSYLEAFELGSFDRFQSGTTGGHDVFQNGHIPARLQCGSTFDPLPGPVAFGLLANNECWQRMPGEVTGQAHRRSQRVGAEREPSNRTRRGSALTDSGKQQSSNQKMALGSESRVLAVDVEVRLPARSQPH